MKRKLIIFDFDGTIADSMWAWDELGKNTLAARGRAPWPDYEKIIRTMSVPNFSVWLSKRYPELGPHDRLMAEWHETMIHNYCNRIPLKAGAVELLTYLKGRGYTLYLASATHYRVLSRALEHFDLGRFFDFVITEEIVGISKRDPKIYQLCMERAGVTQENTYLFEDANHAVKTAYDLGFHVCAISDYSMRDHVEEVRSHCELYLDDFTDTDAILSFIRDGEA